MTNLHTINTWNNLIEQREIDLFEKAIKNKNIMEGPILKTFQKRIGKLLNIDYVLGTPSGTSALMLALMGVGIKPGDEVIIPDLTFIATANAAKVLGAKVLIADTERERPLINYRSIMKLITEKTKAVIVVHLNGRIGCSKKLLKTLHDKNIYVIDDACQAFMSKNADGYAGTNCDIGCFSFGITKTVSTIQGGAVVTYNKELYEKMQIIKTQGLSNVFYSNQYIMPGLNFKLPDALAAIGIGQLDKLQEKISHMKEIEKMYDEAFCEIKEIQKIPKEDGEFLWMSDYLVEDGSFLLEKLKESRINVRPIGARLSTAEYLDGSDENYNNSKFFNKRILYFPSGPNQELDDVRITIEQVQKYFNRRRIEYND